MADDLRGRCGRLIEELGLGRADDIAAVRPLTGGVASDIAAVTVGGQSVCVKFALSKLRVAEDWFAPVHRNAAEYAWLQVAARVAPESAIALHGRSETEHGFAMEMVTGGDVYLWKAALLAEAPDRGEAGQVGDLIGRIHAASARPDFDASPFDNRDDFRALRIEPYLTFSAAQHPEASARINAVADQLYESANVLVHGDVSPKNILMRTAGPVILDAECATMGDACFDPAFCINHLVLKAVHLSGSRSRLLASIGAWWSAYRRHVDWEEPAALEARVCRLLPCLMLARVDGKSPVEYLDEAEKAFVRASSLRLIAAEHETLAHLIAALSAEIDAAGLS